ncbi:aminopeptidase P family protein [Candidatus Bathyarchaeota archaeon]|nr:aminopeptidase P family protein [Candidatus Bathyarchaeota archaeon]
MEAALITNGTSIFYLTGFNHIVTERPAALLVPQDGELVFFGPLLEIDHIKLKTPLIKISKTYLDYPGIKHPMELFVEWIKELGLSNSHLGTDNPAGAAGTSGYTGPSLADKMKETKFTNIGSLFWSWRLVKSEEEVNLIRESAKWGNLAHQFLQDYTEPGLWDVEISQMATIEATRIMKKTLGLEWEATKGGSPCSAGFRGQVGKKSAIPHAIGTNTVIKEGDVLVTGAGADIGGYGSELERTMIVGKPSNKQKKLFDIMCKAQEAAITALKPGNTCADVDKAANEVFHKAGVESLVRHHTGHGIGLGGHEPPYLDQGNSQKLVPGMVVSIEPGIYEIGYAGFRHSDTLVVTEDGCEILTYYPRDIEYLTIL